MRQPQKTSEWDVKWSRSKEMGGRGIQVAWSSAEVPGEEAVPHHFQTKTLKGQRWRCTWHTQLDNSQRSRVQQARHLNARWPCKSQVIITEVVKSSPFSSSVSMLKNWRTKGTENLQTRLVTGIMSKGRIMSTAQRIVQKLAYLDQSTNWQARPQQD